MLNVPKVIAKVPKRELGWITVNISERSFFVAVLVDWFDFVQSTAFYWIFVWDHRSLQVHIRTGRYFVV